MEIPGESAFRAQPGGLPVPRLYDGVLEVLRSPHYSRRSEQAYTHWIHGSLLFHAATHPRELAHSDRRAHDHLQARVELWRAAVRGPLDRLRQPVSGEPRRIRRGDRPEFAARFTDYGAIAEVSMPMRIRRHDKSWYGMEAAEGKKLVASL
jgi:hypothetical protein